MRTSPWERPSWVMKHFRSLCEYYLERTLDPREMEQGITILSMLKPSFTNGPILVAASSWGRDALLLLLRSRRTKPDIIAIDLNPDPLVILHGFTCHTKISVINCSATHLPFPNEFFNGILCANTLEHIPDDSTCIEEIHRLLKPNHTAIVSVPYNPKRMKLTKADARVGHVRRYSKEQLLTALSSHGLKVENSFTYPKMFATPTLYVQVRKR
jgi:SAM-dependent methyltransferase